MRREELGSATPAMIHACVQTQCNRVTAEQRKTVVLGGKVAARFTPKYGSSVANDANETGLRFHCMLAAIYMPLPGVTERRGVTAATSSNRRGSRSTSAEAHRPKSPTKRGRCVSIGIQN